MQQEDQYVSDVDWVGYCIVAWRRRWQIILPTVILAVLAGVASGFLPKVWETDVIIVPGTIWQRSPSGEEKRVPVVDPKRTAVLIAQGIYNVRAADDLNIDVRTFPAVRAENLRDTEAIRVVLRNTDPQMGQQILTALFSQVKADIDHAVEGEIFRLDVKAELENNKALGIESDIQAIQSDIKKKQIDLLLRDLDHEMRLIDQEDIRRDIESDKNKLRLKERRIVDLQAEMDAVRSRVGQLDELQQRQLSERKDEGQAVSLLLYSNEVQANLRYLNDLAGKISAEQFQMENLARSCQRNEEASRRIENEIGQIKLEKERILAEIEAVDSSIVKLRKSIDDVKARIKMLEERKRQADYCRLVKPPTTSLQPVSPRKGMNVALAGGIAFFLSLGIAFLRESVDSRKVKSSSC